MTTTTDFRIADAEHPLWLGGGGHLAGSHGSAEELLEASGLDWSVEQVPLRTDHGPVPGFVANVRSDNGGFLGVVGEGFKPVDNLATLELAEAISGATWLSAGSTRGGARIHALLRLPDDVVIGGLDTERVLPLMHISNGHDGSLALTVQVKPMRLACLNGMLLPVKGADLSWKGRHSNGIELRLDDARKALQLGASYYHQLEETGEQLLGKPMNKRSFERFLEQLVPFPVDVDVTAGGRKVTNVETVRQAIRFARNAPDNANVENTAWGALQAVTRYTTHDARTRKTSGRTESDAAFERITGQHDLVDRAYRLLTL
jgi:phage/plasmid-like protein (TIGR03299 family)